ncbi:putative pectinesterase/pectinesterase inhibitor 28 [Abeliophyllum distichum]|uniref:Pectinesterase n=1 Tax=Abeliophyllum distichum TaxID=126358 RepID=A0ABD1RVB6_9LAMI
MADDHKKNVVAIGICSLLLVAMVVAFIGTHHDSKYDSYDHKGVSDSKKAIQTICKSTDYQKTCVNSLKSSDTSNPKELIELAFEAAKKYINEAAKNSTVLQSLQKDPRAISALDSCHELAERAVNDLQRSYDKFKAFDVSNFNNMLSDIKIWLSGAITYQETCLDGFEDVQGDAGEKMRQSLKTAMELTSNGLAMVTEISSGLKSLSVQGFYNRRLLSKDLPDWIDVKTRKLLQAQPQQIKPDLVVAKDGTGKYTTINEAMKDIPKNSGKVFVLYIKEGVYEEKVQFNSSLINLIVIGDGPTKTRITGKLNFIDGTNTYQTATVAIQGDNFIAKDIGFENSAGPEKHQAVALRVGADKSLFYNCHMDGYQDTLYAHTYRQFYKDCVISGTIDFIFGDSAAVFQGCTMVVRKPMDNQQCIVTAQGRKEARQPTGLVLQNCTIQADPGYYPVRNKLKSYLGRPWKQYSRTIILESFLDDLIQPQGWLPWNETFALDTLFYAEFNNRGPASIKTQRITWPGVKELPASRVQRFTVSQFIDADIWIPSTGVPYAPGFIFPVLEEDQSVKYSPISPDENKDLGREREKTSFISSPDKSSDPEFDLKKGMAPAPAPSAGTGSLYQLKN